jgi:tape measure domain-containing protein
LSVPEELNIHTKLTGDRQVIAGLVAEAEAIRALATSTEAAGTAMHRTTRRSFLMNQALFTVRRFLYSGTIAAVGMTTAVGILGIKFNANMEMNTVAMAHFLGGTIAARRELGFLYDIAARTPFEFADVTAAARKFLAFGFTLQQTNRYLAIVGDTAAGLGVGSEGIQRMVLAFGQMQAKGRIMGDELLQLQEIGVPALQILQQHLGLTMSQMKNIGNLGIPADVGIEALMRGLTKMFKGSAAEQSKTFTGQISTLHDYAMQLMGSLTLPLFNRLRDRVIPQMNLIVSDMQAAYVRGEGFAGAIRAVDERLTPRSHRVMQIFTQLRGLVTDLWTTFRSLGAALIGVQGGAAFLIIPFMLLRGIFFVLAHTTKIWVPLLSTTIALFLTWKIYTLGLAAAQKLLAFWIGAVTVAQNLNVKANKALAFWTGILSVVTKGYVRGANGQFLAMTRLQKVALSLRLAVFQLAAAFEFLFLTTPIGWIALLIIGIGVLYWKVKVFHDWVNQNWPYLAGLLISPFGVLAIYVVRHFDAIKNHLSAFFNWVWKKVKWIGDKLDWLKGKLPHFGLPHFGLPSVSLPQFGLPLLGGKAMGGSVINAGNYLVGERGPEIASLPAGTMVTPNNRLSTALSKIGERIVIEIRPAPVNLDGRKVAEVVFDQQRIAEARA